MALHGLSGGVTAGGPVSGPLGGDLVTAFNEVRRHTAIVLNAPDRPPLCDSLRGKRDSAVRWDAAADAEPATASESAQGRRGAGESTIRVVAQKRVP